MLWNKVTYLNYLWNKCLIIRINNTCFAINVIQCSILFSVSRRIQNETEEKTQARKKDARQRVSQRVQNETEGEAEPIIFYLYWIKF